MITTELRDFFDERFAEIDEYFGLLQQIEDSVRAGAPKIEGASSAITAAQQKILYSSVYLQLYNLVEATVSRCVEAITDATMRNSVWKPDDLNNSLRIEWIKVTARTNIDLTPDHRLQSAVALCDHLLAKLPVRNFAIDIGGGGNWDDDAIEKMGSRLGCSVRVAKATKSSVKRHLRDDLGALQLVKNRRNRLAHGSISFVECAEGLSVAELRLMTDAVGAYLREAIGCFGSYIESFDFLRADRKPVGA